MDRGLSAAERRCLELLDERSTVTSAEVATALAVSRGHASRLLRRLQEAGLLCDELAGGGVLTFRRRAPRR